MTQMNMVKALNRALHDEMARDPDVVVLGEDVGVDEGVFRVTEGLLKKFGAQRVLDTPLAEAAIVGMSVGMAMYGLKPVCEIQFAGFCYLDYDQLESHAARIRNRTRGRFHCQMVLRTPYGGGIRAVEHHSESREAIYAHTPGLKMVIPSGPRNARALLLSAMRDPDPVLFFEPAAVYRTLREEVPDEEETLPLGKAQVTRRGNDITLIAYGAMMRPTLAAAEALAQDDGVHAEVIDLLSLYPMDTDTIVASVKRTGRAVVVHEAPRTCGIGAEVVARLVEHAFLYLEAPVRRLTGFDIPFPYFAREKAYLPTPARIARAVRQTLNF
jgi:pyruvate dehydrogenase E1 component beta subunit